jgi:plasmid stabilization system protein ParE
MAFEIHWLRRASNELDAIHQFYSEFASEQVAKRRIGIIIHSVDLLQTMPYLGRMDEDFTHIRSYRYLIVLTYKVYYFVEDDGVYIASILDCRQGGAAFI